MPLIAFEHRPGDLGGLGEAALGAPLQEEPMYIWRLLTVYSE